MSREDKVLVKFACGHTTAVMRPKAGPTPGWCEWCSICGDFQLINFVEG